MAKECNFPDCDNPAKTRGLCVKHYWQASRGADPAVRKLAADSMNPPKEGYANRAGKPGASKPKQPPAAKRKAFKSPDADARPDSPPLHIGALSDDARAAVHESYIALGAKAVRFGQNGCRGMLYIFPDAMRSIWIGPEGRIEPAEIHKGANKEKIA